MAFQKWHEPRETPENWSFDVLARTGAGPALIAPGVTGEKVEFPTVKMRGENLFCLAVKAGRPVEVVLRNHPLAHYESLLAWDVRNSEMAKIAKGMIPHNTTGAVTFTPETDGIYLLGASAGSCTYSVVSANVPIGLYAVDRLGLIFGANRLYFKVPDGVDEFTLTAKGSSGETVRVNVYDPEGNQVATGQTSFQNTTARIEV